MSRAKLAIFGGVIIVIGVLLNSGLFTVSETQQVLVLQLGEHKRTVREPGLHFKVPLIQNVVAYDKRVLSVDPPAEEMLLSDQKRILVDAFARYRITDPLKFFQTVRDEQIFGNRFGNILTSTVKEFVAQRELADLLSDQRNVIMESIRDGVAIETSSFGIEVVDIRIGRSELPEAVSQTVYERMRTERERQSNKLRAEGEENARRIRAEADRQQVEIVAEAQREAETLRGGGDATRNAILGESYGKDPEFFEFFRSLEAYKETFAAEGTTMVLSPNSDFFKYFGDLQGGRDRVSGREDR
ncbi:MAG: protease modulator HflC [Rhodospirillaceae bacterium]|jgi:membrane protease subunit HflC|nr:protease modulator HflC [Rhodospirillaceae bacterium]MBT6403444.1 protease modulator HflC [Rhodospirillaceae bacterium]MBT6536687.1 protease modulator HflC [Rhodospirillaceae bacterium]MBT7361062.1 protease modulator HflC [Rhodospirillaceae bacterium]